MPGPGGRPLIAWDVDDVLNDLTDAHLAWRGETIAPRKNPPHDELGLSRAAYLASLDEFRLARAGALPPRADVAEWFAAHGERFEHLALTAVPLVAAHVSADWTLRHFGRWIQAFHVTPSPRDGDPPELVRSKAATLAWLGRVDLFVDDSDENVAAARAAGVRALTFPRPWNASRRTPAEALAEISR